MIEFLLVVLAVVSFVMYVRSTAQGAPTELADQGKGVAPLHDTGLEYRLVPLDTNDGAGFVVERIEDKQRLLWSALPKSDGLRAFNVAGVSHRRDVLQQPEFAPGSVVELIPEPDNEHDPNAVGVWDEDGAVQVGWVPREDAKAVSRWIGRDEGLTAIVMWEHTEGGTRRGIRVLIATAEAAIELP
jgi:hypothetical protein